MTQRTLLSLALHTATGLSAQVNTSERSHELMVHFLLDSDKPEAADVTLLRSLCDREDIDQVTGITITGRTDLRGSLEYNEALSRRRADAVRSILSTTCLKDKELAVRWSGEADPLVLGNVEPAFKENRSVVVSLTMANATLTEAVLIGHPLVTPLLPAIDKPREHHRCDASQGIDVTMSDGTRVRIPAHAIIDANGNPVECEVELSYRSFNEPYEIIASGIPMHIGAGADAQHMETAGMYELYAMRDNERLALAPGQQISIDPPAAAPLDPAFVGWQLDPSSGTWTNAGSLTAAPIVPVLSTTASMATKATITYWNELGELERDARPDSTLFEQRRESTNYCHLTRCDTAPGDASWFRKRRNFRAQAQVPEINVKGYKGIYKEDNILFTVALSDDDDRQFPEWRRLPNNVVWRYEGDEPKAVFKQLYGRKHYYQDIDLRMANGSDQGTLRLKENGQWIELPVTARFDQRKEFDPARWHKAVANYNASRAKQKRNFDRDVTRQTARYRRDHASMPLTAWKKAQPDMNDSERTLLLDAWQGYASTRRLAVVSFGGDWQQQQKALASVQTTFGLEGFGVYNIDRIMKMSDQLNVLAAAVGPDDKPWPWVNGFAVLKGENSVITYWGNSEGKGDMFLVSPGKMKSLFLVDAEGHIARADVAPLNANELRVVLKVEPMEEVKSIDELRAQAN